MKLCKFNHALNNKAAVLSVAVALVLSGCTTTGSLGGHLSSSDAKQSAKDTLKQTVKSQLRTSFGYETTIYPSSQSHHLSQSQPDESCESVHDTAYVAMLGAEKAAEQAGVHAATVANDKAKLALTIKEGYLACVEARTGVSRYQPYDFEAFYENNKNLSPEALSAALQRDLVAHVGTQIANETDEQSDMPTALDVKKSQLINEYLIKPSKTTITGSYQPLAGVLTALPKFTYDSKNLKASINQPIYVDLKAGTLYLWADNAAFINSQAVDKELGDQWQNKWLAITLEDGSLPKGFAKDFIKAYANAKVESLEVLDEGSVQLVGAQSVLDLPHFAEMTDEGVQHTIANTATIIQKSPDSKMRAYSRYVFYDTLYQDITAKYPQLIEEMLPQQYQLGGEGDIEVILAHAATQNDNEEDSSQYNSRALMQRLLALIKYRIDDYYAKLYEGESAFDSAHEPVQHYGVHAGRISWLHERHYLSGGAFARLTLKNTPAFVDVFTVIKPYAKHEFERLPAQHRTPNATNSVNLYEWRERMADKLDTPSQLLLQLGGEE